MSRLLLALLVLGIPPLAHADDVITPPKRLSAPPQEEDFYPAEAKRQHQQGSGIFRVCIGTDGVASTAIVSSTGYPLLDASAQDSFRKSQWAPATQNGAPIVRCQVIRVSYCMKGSWNGSRCEVSDAPSPPAHLSPSTDAAPSESPAPTPPTQPTAPETPHP